MTTHRFSDREKIRLSIKLNRYGGSATIPSKRLIKPNGITRIGPSGVGHLVGRCETHCKTSAPLSSVYKTATTKLKLFTGILTLKWCSETTWANTDIR